MKDILLSIQHAHIRWFQLLVGIAGVIDYFLLVDWKFWLSVFLCSLVIALIRFFMDKKWLAVADEYVRIHESRSRMRFAITVILYLGIGFITIYFRDELPDLDDNLDFNVFLICVFLLSGSDYFVHFVNSVKSFKNGIQLPGRKGELLPWKDIYTFEINETLHISSVNGDFEYEIDSRDYSYARKLIADWEKNRKLNVWNA